MRTRERSEGRWKHTFTDGTHLYEIVSYRRQRNHGLRPGWMWQVILTDAGYNCDDPDAPVIRVDETDLLAFTPVASSAGLSV